MKNNNLGIIIRKRRKELGLNTVQLAKKVNYSRSYISRVENGIIDVSDETFTVIFKALGITYKIDQDCREFERNIDKVLTMFLYLNIDRDFIDRVIMQSNDFNCTNAYSKFLIANLVYKVNFLSKEIETERYIKQMDKTSELYNNKEKQIIYDYIGCYYLDYNYELAKKYFDRALEFGEYPYSTSILYYHLGMLNYKFGNYFDANEFCKKAFDKFSLELNYKRMFYTNLHIAIINSKSGNYEAAYVLFNEMILNPNLSEEQLELIYGNLCWLLIKKNEYDEALIYAQKSNINYLDYYFHLALIYYKLTRLDDATKIIEIGLSKFKDCFQEKQLIIISKIITKECNTNEYEDLLVKTFKQAKKSEDSESVKFIKDLLIEFYEAKHQYKEVCKLMKSC